MKIYAVLAWVAHISPGHRSNQHASAQFAVSSLATILQKKGREKKTLLYATLFYDWQKAGSSSTVNGVFAQVVLFLWFVTQTEAVQRVSDKKQCCSFKSCCHALHRPPAPIPHTARAYSLLANIRKIRRLQNVHLRRHH